MFVRYKYVGIWPVGMRILYVSVVNIFLFFFRETGFFAFICESLGTLRRVNTRK